MADSAFWIASLTAGTAVLASWVTSRGTARAARIQADTTTRAQRAERLRDSRRTAYADLMERAQRMGDLYWKVSDLCADDVIRRLPELDRLRDRLRDEYSGLRHCTWIVSLEGGRRTAPHHHPRLSCRRGDTRRRPHGPGPLRLGLRTVLAGTAELRRAGAAGAGGDVRGRCGPSAVRPGRGLRVILPPILPGLPGAGAVSWVVAGT
jgi:hypothetical protein